MSNINTTPEVMHLGDYAYRAIKQIAEENNNIIELNVDKSNPREELINALKDCISKFNKPVLITNILIYTLIETFFSKNEDADFIFNLSESKTFDIHLNPLLSGFYNEFVIFEEDSFDTATIVRYNPDSIV